MVHALDSRHEQLMRLSEVPLWALHERRDALRIARGVSHLKALAARAQVSTRNIAFRVAHGDAWRAVLSIQDEVDAQVVVMMKHKATPLADFILGSTVRRLLTRLHCDILVAPATRGSHLSEVEVAPRPLPLLQT